MRFPIGIPKLGSQPVMYIRSGRSKLSGATVNSGPVEGVSSTESDVSPVGPASGVACCEAHCYTASAPKTTLARLDWLSRAADCAPRPNEKLQLTPISEVRRTLADATSHYCGVYSRTRTSEAQSKQASAKADCSAHLPLKDWFIKGLTHSQAYL